MKLTIGRKLYAILLIACIGIGVLAELAIIQATRMAEAGAILHSKALPGFEKGAELALLFEQQSGSVGKVPAELDLGKQQQAKDAYQSRSVLIEKLLGEFKKLAVEEDKELIGMIGEQLPQLNDAAFKVFNYASNFAVDQAVSALNKDYAPIDAKIRDSIAQFSQNKLRLADSSAANLSAAFFLLEKALLIAAASIVFFLLISGIFLVRNITRRIGSLNRIMSLLSANDLSVSISGIEDKDEIGEMATTVSVFKDSMLKARELEKEAEMHKENAKISERNTQLKVAQEFERTINSVAVKLGASVHELQTTTTFMTETVKETSDRSSETAAIYQEVRENVNAVASATEELSASVSEITSQVNQSMHIIGEAVSQAGDANSKVQGLEEAAQKIGAVVQLISDIASQTNLLALNATIEAARAGEAGKGFAVVASEVKTLASQTAKATEEISEQINTIQEASRSSGKIIEEVVATIHRVNNTATAIASAVEQQGAATQEIARSISDAAHGTANVSSNINAVVQAANVTGNSAEKMLQAVAELHTNNQALKFEIGKFLQTVRAENVA